MAFIHFPKDWQRVATDLTPESAWKNRRAFLKRMGFSGLGIAGLLGGWGALIRVAGAQDKSGSEKINEGGKPGVAPAKKTAGDAGTPGAGRYPAKRNPAYTVKRALTAEAAAAGYINFYEFSTDKRRAAKLGRALEVADWSIEIAGLVKKPRRLDFEALLRMFPLEERVYRFRCVEAWAMTVPWTGIPLGDVIRRLDPLPSAKYVRFKSFMQPKNAPGQASGPYAARFPYYEGLTMKEATNPLALLATGIYGHALPGPHGAPLRLVLPWKYGFKSLKSVVSMEFTEKRPKTFWSDLVPHEYDFLANVDPDKPHPRWSQATERLLGSGTPEKRVPTRKYNGYGELVAGLYKKSR